MKWLRGLKGHQLTEEEIEHYQKIVVALNETISIRNEIDVVLEGHGGGVACEVEGKIERWDSKSG